MKMKTLPFMFLVMTFSVFLAITVFTPSTVKPEAAEPPSTSTAGVVHAYLASRGVDSTYEECASKLRSDDLDGVYDCLRVFVPMDKTVIKVCGNDMRYLPYGSLVYTGEWRIFTYASELTARYSDADGASVELPVSELEVAYTKHGKRAIYITDRGYLP